MQYITSKKMNLINQDFHQRITHNPQDIRISNPNFNTLFHTKRIIPSKRKWVNLSYRMLNLSPDPTTNSLNINFSRNVNYRVGNTKLNFNFTINPYKQISQLKRRYKKSIIKIVKNNNILTNILNEEMNIARNTYKSPFSYIYKNKISKISNTTKQEYNSNNHLILF